MLGFSILGPIEVRHGPQILPITGMAQQTLLLNLLVREGAVVTANDLIDEIWGPAPPAKVENALHAQVSRLRRHLAAVEPERACPRVTKCPAGYRLAMDDAEVDAVVFLRKVQATRTRMGLSAVLDLEPPLHALHEALDLWEEPVFGGLTGGTHCRAALGKYQEAKTLAYSMVYELEMMRGDHAKVLPDLIEHFVQDPFNEQYCRLLMIALYRIGSQTEALDVYRRFRRNLGDRLGLEPSPVLRRCEQAILLHDSALLAASSPLSPVPHDLTSPMSQAVAL